MRVLSPLVIELPPRVGVTEHDDFALPLGDQLPDPPIAIQLASEASCIGVRVGRLDKRDHRYQELQP